MIDDIRYEIEGITREESLKHYLDLPEKPGFDDYAAMAAYVEKQEQRMINLRIFDKVETDLSPMDRNSEEGPVLYRLTVSVSSSWTFFPLMVPTFDTNDELTLKTKISYSNVFGTLIDMAVDADFLVGIDPETDEFGIDYWTLETQMSNIYLWGLDLSFLWIQSHQRNISKIDGDIDKFYTYDKTEFLVSSTFDLGQDYYYIVGPGLEFTYNYNNKNRALSSYEKEPQSYGIYQEIGLDRVNWIGNFKKGYQTESDLKVRMVWNDGRDTKAVAGMSASYFDILTPRISWGCRFKGLLGMDDKIYELGEYMRGVPDFDLTGDSALFLNTTLPISVAEVSGLAEGQIAPFIDMGIVNPVKGEFDSQEHMRMTGGLDFLVFRRKLPQYSSEYLWDTTFSVPDLRENATRYSSQLPFFWTRIPRDGAFPPG